MTFDIAVYTQLYDDPEGQLIQSEEAAETESGSHWSDNDTKVALICAIVYAGIQVIFLLAYCYLGKTKESSGSDKKIYSIPNFEEFRIHQTE